MNLKVLSVRQPWAWLLIKNIKDVENRNWEPQNPPYRGRLYIHASGNYTPKHHAHMLNLIEYQYGYTMPADPAVFLIGCIIGHVDLWKITDGSESIWYQGPPAKAWHCRNGQEIEFIPAKGKLGIWEYDL